MPVYKHIFLIFLQKLTQLLSMIRLGRCQKLRYLLAGAILLATSWLGYWIGHISSLKDPPNSAQSVQGKIAHVQAKYESWNSRSGQLLRDNNDHNHGMNQEKGTFLPKYPQRESNDDHFRDLQKGEKFGRKSVVEVEIGHKNIEKDNANWETDQDVNNGFAGEDGGGNAQPVDRNAKERNPGFVDERNIWPADRNIRPRDDSKNNRPKLRKWPAWEPNVNLQEDQEKPENPLEEIAFKKSDLKKVKTKDEILLEKERGIYEKKTMDRNSDLDQQNENKNVEVVVNMKPIYAPLRNEDLNKGVQKQILFGQQGQGMVQSNQNLNADKQKQDLDLVERINVGQIQRNGTQNAGNDGSERSNYNPASSVKDRLKSVLNRKTSIGELPRKKGSKSRTGIEISVKEPESTPKQTQPAFDPEGPYYALVHSGTATKVHAKIHQKIKVLGDYVPKESYIFKSNR